MVAFGADVGGTNARTAVVDRSTGAVLATAKAVLTDKTVEGVVETLGGLFDQLSSRFELRAGPVGVAFAGMVRGPMVVNAPNFGWRDVDLGSVLARRVKRPIRLVNDLSAAAWGELKAGAARGANETFTVFVGTGVGSAVVVRGALVSGATDVAGEFGHIKVVEEGGRPCGCGQFGCLEAYMGGANLERWMREVGVVGSLADLERLALSGDALAKPLYDFAVGHLALAVANQVTVLNPAVVVLGGGVLERNPGMVQRIVDVVRRRACVPAQAGLAVRMAELGDDSGIVGAALLE
jgi:glucokinase